MQISLKEACHELGLQQDVELLRIEKGGRWVLAYTQNPEMPHFGRHMIKLERRLKANTGQQNIELLCETIEDRNRRFKRTNREEEMAKLTSARGIESLD